MNHFCDHQYTAFIGIDWADTKHDICLQAADSDQREFACIPHQVDRIEQWALSLHQRFGGPIAIALELRSLYTEPGQGRSDRCRTGSGLATAPPGSLPATGTAECGAASAGDSGGTAQRPGQ